MAAKSGSSGFDQPTADPDVVRRFERIAEILAGPTSPTAQPVDISDLQIIDVDSLLERASQTPEIRTPDEVAQRFGSTTP